MTITDLQIDAAFTLDLIEKLKEIKTVNGYLTNIGLHVEHNISEPIPESDSSFEGINVVDGDAEQSVDSLNAENYRFEVTINTIGVQQSNPWQHVKNMNRDVRRCVGLCEKDLREKYFLQNLIIRSHGVENIEEAPKQIGEGKVVITTQYKVNRFGIDEKTYSVEVTE